MNDESIKEAVRGLEKLQQDQEKTNYEVDIWLKGVDKEVK